MLDLDQYDKFISELSPILNLETTRQHILFPLLLHEIHQIRDLLYNLKPHKTKRSLNFIGTAWKWIAGNPDHDDFITIKEKMTDTLRNNNKQVIINKLYNDRINNITRVQNKIYKLLSEDSNFQNDVVVNAQYKIKLIKEDLENINYAIHWAKMGIINSIILSKNEIKFATQHLDKQNLPYTTIEEALDFAEIKIISNSSSLIYVINIPLTTNEMFQQLLIKPLKRNNLVIEILYNVILKNNEELYGITKKCKTYNYLSICKSQNIVDIRNNTCIPNLLKSQPATCNTMNNQHIPTIDEISTGVLLLNQFTGLLETEDITHKLNGTFLIKFHNSTVRINGNTFISQEASMITALPAILQPNPKENQYRELLSLEMMKEIHINNTNAIKLLEAEGNKHQITTYTVIICIALFLTFAIIRKFASRNFQTKIIIQKPEEIIPEETHIPQTIVERNLLQIASHNAALNSQMKPRFNDIPYF